MGIYDIPVEDDRDATGTEHKFVGVKRVKTRVKGKRGVAMKVTKLPDHLKFEFPEVF